MQSRISATSPTNWLIVMMIFTTGRVIACRPRLWRRVGQHSEFDLFSGDEWLAFYGLHAQDHAVRIRRARKAHTG